MHTKRLLKNFKQESFRIFLELVFVLSLFVSKVNRGVIHFVLDLYFVLFSSVLTFCKIFEKHSIFNVSPVQVLCKQGWHLLFTSHSDFLKMLKNRIKIGQYRLHLYCPRFLVRDQGLEPWTP